MKRFLALLFVSLILSMPVAVAQTLNIQQFSGQDGVPNVAKPNDKLRVRALVSVPADAVITPNQVRLTSATGITFLFTECTPAEGAGLYTCSITYDLIGESGATTYIIGLFNDDNEQVLVSSQKLTTDFVAPDMLTLTADPVIIGTNPTTLTYLARDYAFSPGDTSECAGVGSIKLYEGSTSSTPTATIAGGADCELSGTTSYSPRGSGNVSICAIAYDRLGKASSPKCVSVVADRAPPEFTSYRILTQDGFRVHAIPPSGLTTNVEVRIKEVALDVNSVRADLSSLAGPQFSSVPPTDIGQISDGYLAVFRNVELRTVTPCRFTIRANDVLANPGSKEFTCSIIQDITPPVLLGIETGYQSDDGTPLLGVQGRLVARFTEPGGMERANAFIDASTLGLGTNRKADRCVQDGSEWRCEWQLPGGVPTARYGITLLGTTADDLGNAINTNTPFQLDYDPEPPVIVSGPLVEVFHASQEYADQLVKGDTIELTYNVSGATSATADFFQLGGGNRTSGICDSEICVVSQTVERSGGYSATITLWFFDAAGNQVNTTHDVDVFGVINEPNPNYWDSTITCSPAVIDRSVTAYVNHQVYCHVDLSSQSAVDVAATALGDASECVGALDGNVVGLELINNGFLSKDPYLRILLAQKQFEEGLLNFTCPIYILTKVGNNFTSFPERENVTVDLQFGTSTTSDLAGTIDDKIDDAVEDAEKLNKWLDAAVKILDFSKKLCQLRQMFWNVAAVFEVAHAILTLIGLIPGGSVVEPIRTALCAKKETYKIGLGSSIDTPLRTYCALVNCEAAFGLTSIGGLNLGVQSFDQAYSGQDTGTAGGQPAPAEQRPPQAIVDPKQSIVWAIITLCIPGIIYNVDKYRQIQCRYATCLVRDVKEQGVPMSVCDDEKAYLTCNLIWGQIFALIPFANIVQYYINVIREWIANPFALAGLITSVFCADLCESGGGNVACVGLKVIEVIGRVIGDIQTIKQDDYFKLGSGPCQEMEDAVEEAEE